MSDGKCDRAFVYKCRLCGKSEADMFIYADRLKVIAIISDLNFKGVHKDPVNQQGVQLTFMHFCEDGGVGISDFQGMKVKEPE